MIRPARSWPRTPHPGGCGCRAARPRQRRLPARTAWTLPASTVGRARGRLLPATPTVSGSSHRDSARSQQCTVRRNNSPSLRGEHRGAGPQRGRCGRRRSEGRKIGEYYASFMDEAGIEKQGSSLCGRLEKHRCRKDAPARASVSRHAARRRRCAEQHQPVHRQPAGLWVAQDLDDPARYAPFLLAGRPGDAGSRLLPGRSAKMPRCAASTRRISLPC